MPDVPVSGSIDLSLYLGETKEISADPIGISFIVFGQSIKDKTVTAFNRLTFSVEAVINRVRPAGGVNFTLSFAPEVRMTAPLPPAPLDDLPCEKTFTTPFLDCEKAPASYSSPQLKVGCKCPEDEE